MSGVAAPEVAISSVVESEALDGASVVPEAEVSARTPVELPSSCMLISTVSDGVRELVDSAAVTCWVYEDSIGVVVAFESEVCRAEVSETVWDSGAEITDVVCVTPVCGSLVAKTDVCAVVLRLEWEEAMVSGIEVVSHALVELSSSSKFSSTVSDGVEDGLSFHFVSP